MGKKNSKVKKEDSINKKFFDKITTSTNSDEKAPEKKNPILEIIKEKPFSLPEDQKSTVEKPLPLPEDQKSNTDIFTVEKTRVFNIEEFITLFYKQPNSNPVQFKSYCAFHETPFHIYIHSTKYNDYDLFKIEKKSLAVAARIKGSYSARIFPHKFKNKPVRDITIRYKIGDREFLYDKDLRKNFDMGEFLYIDKNGNIKKANSSNGYLVSSLDPQDDIVEFKLFSTASNFYGTKYVKYYHLTRKKILLNRRFEDNEYIIKKDTFLDFLRDFVGNMDSFENDTSIFRGASPIWRRKRDDETEFYNFTDHGDLFKRDAKFNAYVTEANHETMRDFIFSLKSTSDELKKLFSEENKENLQIKELKFVENLSSDEDNLAVFSLLLVNSVYDQNKKLTSELRMVLFSGQKKEKREEIKFDILKELCLMRVENKIRHYFWESKRGILNVVIDGEAGDYDYSKDFRFIYRVKQDFSMELICKTFLKRNKVVDDGDFVKIYLSDESSFIDVIKIPIEG